MNKKNLYPMLQALLAALLFGASAPIAKVLLGDVEPIPLAGLLYLGSGISLLAVKAYQRLIQKSRETEAGITSPDIKWLAGAILTGGIAAPIILLFSLRETPGATASLLLNFEGVATMLIAALIFKEGIGRDGQSCSSPLPALFCQQTRIGNGAFPLAHWASLPPACFGGWTIT